MQRDLLSRALQLDEPDPRGRYLNLFSSLLGVDCLFLNFRLLLADLQDRKNYVSLPPLMENGAHDEAAFVAEQDGDEESPPPAYSPSEEAEEEEEEEEAPLKRRKRKHVDSAAATSPLKEAEKEDSSSSSSEANKLVDPLIVTPLSSAPPVEFGKMASPSVSTEGEDVDR